MKIEKPKVMEFQDVKVGQVFGYGDDIFIRILTIEAPDKDVRLANSVNLQTGADKLIKDLQEVTLYENAKVVIE